MADKRIEYDVRVDAGDANRKLREFGRAAERAGKDAEQAFDDTGSAADKAAAAIVQMGNKIDTEIRAAADAADALARALGPELAGKIDLDQTVADLERMGLTLDDIKGSADKLAGAIKEVDSQTTGRVSQGMAATRDRTNEVSDSARGANSALANMIGNTSQTLGGLYNIVGDVGVGIGQMAEYAADAALQGEKLSSVLGSMAAVAGPIAALAGATALVNDYLGRQSRIKAWRAEQVQSYKDAVDEVGAGLEAVQKHLEETGDQAFTTGQDWSDFFGQSETTVENMVASMGVMGLHVGEVSEAIGAGASDTDRGRRALAQLEQQLLDAGYSAGLIAPNLDYLREQQDAYAEATANATGEGRFFSATQEDINKALSANAQQLGNTEIQWRNLLRDLKDGRVENNDGILAWNELRDSLGLTNDEMTELANQKLADQIEADAQAAADAAERFREFSAQTKALKDNVAEYNHVVSSAEFGKTSIEAAQTALSQYFDTWNANTDQAIESEDAWTGVGDALTAADEAGVSWFDTLFGATESPEARQVHESLKQLGTALIPDIQKAFDDSDGDINKFRTNMATLGERTLQRLMNQFGLTRDEANALAQQLGLIPENVETMYNLIGTEDAKLKLDLLQGYIDDLPENVQTTITQKIIMGDYQGALAVVQNYANSHHIKQPANPEAVGVKEFQNNLQSILSGNPLSQPVIPKLPRGVTQGTPDRGRAAAASSSAGLTTYASPAPTAAAAPVSVTINAGVVGNRYDVERTVARALRGYTRLSGRR